MHCKVIPSYVNYFKRQYICLLGINQDFGYLIKDLDIRKVKKGSLKKREKSIDRIYNYIKRYGEAVKSRFFEDLSEQELPYDVFVDIENVEWLLDDIIDIYLEIITEEDEDYQYDDCIYKINKKNMKIMLTKITQG